MQQSELSRQDRITVNHMATAMREGFTTRDELAPQFGGATVDRLGDLAVAEARRRETSAR